MKRRKTAKANVEPVRQRSQFSCMACSMAMALRSLGIECTEDEVGKVMGVAPMRGATWEDAIAAAQHYGCRATLVSPSTITQVKEWTDQGDPVVIAWNPENREWSHASVIFDVDKDQTCHIADPNIPDPEETVRIVSRKDFYSKWAEKWPRYLVRRPAMCVSREITPEGKQVMAMEKRADRSDRYRALNTLRQHVEPKMLAKHLVTALGDAAVKKFLTSLAKEHDYPLELVGGGSEMLLEALRYMDVDTFLDEAADEMSDKDMLPALQDVAAKHRVFLASEATVYQEPLLSNADFERVMKEARFKECPDKEKGCMSAEEVSKVVGPEFAEEQDKNTGKIQGKKKKANPRLSSEDFGRILEGRFEEGKEMSAEDVANYLRDHGAPEAADKWLAEHEKNKDKLKKKGAMNPGLKRLDDQFLNAVRALPQTAGNTRLASRVRTSQRKKARSRLTKQFPDGIPGIHKKAGLGGRITPALIEDTFRDVSPEDAKKLAAVLQRAGSDRNVSKALQLANEVLDGFGVEDIRGVDTWSNYWGDAIAMYVNTGDTYNPTIIYDIDEGKFYLTDYGTWMKKYERSGGRVKAAKWTKKNQPKTVADWLGWEA